MKLSQPDDTSHPDFIPLWDKTGKNRIWLIVALNQQGPAAVGCVTGGLDPRKISSLERVSYKQGPVKITDTCLISLVLKETHTAHVRLSYLSCLSPLRRDFKTETSNTICMRKPCSCQCASECSRF